MNKGNNRNILLATRSIVTTVFFCVTALALSGQAIDDTENTAHDYILTYGNVSANDNLPAGVRAHRFLNEASLGSIQWVDSIAGIFVYLVDPINVQLYGNEGIPARLDSIYYEVCVPTHCDTALIEVFIALMPDNPVANPDTFYVEAGSMRWCDVSINDYDPDSISDPNQGSSRFFKVTSPQHINIELSELDSIPKQNGTFLYIPEDGFLGEDEFLYSHWEPEPCNRHSQPCLVTIFVVPENASPFASQINLGNINEESVRNQNLAFFTFDPEGEPLTYRIIEQGAGGTGFTFSNGAFTYTAALNFIGPDTLYYEVTDLVGQTDTAAIILNVVNANNDAPLAPQRNFTATEDTPLNVSIAFEDTVDGDILSYSIETPPAHGTATISSAGILIYTPNANYAGPEVITYRSCDSGNLCSTAAITIEVIPVNDSPDVSGDTNELPINGTLTGGLQTNVSDIDSPINGMNYSLTEAATNGNVVVEANGNYSYTPNEYFYGNDTFTYTVCDNEGGCASGIVDITVTLVNLPPQAENTVITLNEDTETIISLDPFTFDFGNSDLIYSIVDSPVIGTFSNITNQGFNFQPELNSNGTFLISYRVCDTGNLCDTAQVEITILPINDTPVAFNSTFEGFEDAVLNWQAQYTDIDDDALMFTILQSPIHGTLQGNTYISELDFYGTDTFSYQVCDDSGACAQGYFDITIAPVNDSPIAIDEIIEGLEDNWISGSVSANDIDIDSSILNYFLIDQNNPYNLELANDGSFTWLPPNNFSGNIYFEYRCCDAEGLCDTALTMLSIDEVNDIPLVSFPAIQIEEDSQAEYTAIYYAFDTEGQNIQQSIVTAQGVEVLLNPISGFLQLTSSANYFGDAFVVMNTCDAMGGCSVDTIFIDIQPVNDAPFGFNDEYSTFQNAPLSGSWYNHAFDIDDTALYFTAVTAFGTLTISDVGTFEYTPLENFLGSDTIWLQACDSSDACTSLLFLLEVLPPNQAPFVTNAQRTICQGSSASIALSELAFDEVDTADNLQYAFTSSVGSTYIIDGETQSLIITPTSFFTGEMTIEFNVCDNEIPSLCSGGDITLNVTPITTPEIIAVTVHSISCFGMNDGNIIIEQVSDSAGVSYLWENSSTDSAIYNLGAGEYSVQITGLSDCSTSTIAQFNITEPQELSVQLNVQSISSPNSTLIESEVTGGTPPYSFQWEGPDNYNANTPDISNLTSAGQYNLVVTDANDCSVETSTLINSTFSTKFETLLVYPNPTRGQDVQVLLPSDVHAGAVIRLIDSVGSIVFETITSTNRNVIPVNEYSSGIYYLNVSGSMNNYQTPIVIEP